LAQTFSTPPIFSSSAKVWRKGLAQTFSTPPIFSSSAKVWRKHFQLHLFFYQAQRFGINIFNSAYFFIKRKGLAQTFSTPPIFSPSAKVWRKDSQEAPRFSESAEKFPVKSF
jgi:hypothetical protein